MLDGAMCPSDVTGLVPKPGWASPSTACQAFEYLRAMMEEGSKGMSASNWQQNMIVAFSSQMELSIYKALIFLQQLSVYNSNKT